MKTTVTKKGQITIPKQLRDRMGLRAGAILDVDEEDGRIVARKRVPPDALDELVGIHALPSATDGFIRDLRGLRPPPD